MLVASPALVTNDKASNPLTTLATGAVGILYNPKNDDQTYTFSAEGTEVAKVFLDTDNNAVTITGRNYHKGATLSVTVALKE